MIGTLRFKLRQLHWSIWHDLIFSVMPGFGCPSNIYSNFYSIMPDFEIPSPPLIPITYLYVIQYHQRSFPLSLSPPLFAGQPHHFKTQKQERETKKNEWLLIVKKEHIWVEDSIACYGLYSLRLLPFWPSAACYMTLPMKVYLENNR